MPVQIGRQLVTFADPQEEERKKRMAWGKAQGLDDATIARYELIAKVQAQQKQKAQQPQQAQPQPQPKQGAFRSNSVLGFGTSLLPFGEVLRKKLNKEKVTAGDVALEGILTALPVAGKLLGKGAKAAKGLTKAGQATKAATKTADVANDVNKEKNLLKALITPSKAGAEGTTLTQKAGQALSKNSTIAPTSTVGSANQQRKLVKFSQEEGLLRGSSARKFKNVEQVIGKRTDEVDALLAGVKKTVPASDLQKSLSSVRATIPDAGEASDFDKILGRIQKEIGDKPKYTALEINKARRVLNKELGSVNRKLEKGNPLTRGDRALQDAHEAFTDTLNKLAPKEVSNKVKEVNQRISTFIKGQPEFKKKSESADLLGARGQLIPRIPILKPALESATDIAGRTLSKVGKAGSTPLGRQAQVRAPFSVASALGASQPAPEATSPGQLPQDVSQVFANPQSDDEAMLNEITAAGITDPDEMFNALSESSQPNAGVDEMGSATPMGASSAELFKMALDSRMAGDTKGSKDLLEFAKVAQQFEKENKPAAGKAIKKTETQRARDNAALLTEKAMQQLEAGSVNTGLVSGNLEKVKGVLGKADPESLAFNTTISNLKALIAKANAGTSFTSGEKALLKQYAPSVGDSGQVLREKLTALHDVFSKAQESEYGSGQASSGSVFDFSDDELVQQLTEQRGY